MKTQVRTVATMGTTAPALPTTATPGTFHDLSSESSSITVATLMRNRQPIKQPGCQCSRDASAAGVPAQPATSAPAGGELVRRSVDATQGTPAAPGQPTGHPSRTQSEIAGRGFSQAHPQARFMNLLA